MNSYRLDRLGWKNRLFDGLIILFLICLMATMIIPLLNVLSLSFSSGVASMQPNIILFPRDFSTNGYALVWKTLNLWRPFLNSVNVTVIGTISHVLLTSLAGYVLVQPRLIGKKIIITFILITMMIPQEAILIPLYVVNKDLHLINTLQSLILSGLVSGFSILLMRNYFLSVTYEITESAKIDGAGHLRIFSSIYLPLSLAGLATVILFEFVGRWNAFTAPLLFIRDADKYTLQLALKTIITDQNNKGVDGMVITTNVRMAGIIISILPLIFIFPFVQRFFMGGIMLGATKE